MTITPTKTLDLNPCGPRYYLSRTPAGGGIQPNGRWWNLGELFSLSNGASAESDAVINLYHGRSPDGRHTLCDVNPPHAVELTFRADPTVMALWSSLDPERRAVIEQAHLEAVAYSLQAAEWNECAYQAPLYSRFLPAPADILGVLFQHIHTAELDDHDTPPPGALHVHCLLFPIARARVTRAWGPLHRTTFTDALAHGARIYQELFMRFLHRRLHIDFVPYHYDETGARYRVIGDPIEWHLFCGDPGATIPPLRPLVSRPN